MPALASKAARRLVSACLALTIAPLLDAAPALAQEAPPVATGEGGDRFYCEERRLGYWFYCTRPKPAWSSASRMEPTRPSIMSLGATMSTPAAAWVSACCTRIFTVGSFNM